MIKLFKKSLPYFLLSLILLLYVMGLMSVQSEMKLFGISDAEALKQHFGRKIMELEDEKRAVQVR